MDIGLAIQQGGRFCSLEYRLRQSEGSGAPSARLILLVVEGREGRLLGFVAPGLSEIVCDADRQYVQELLADIRERVGKDPEALFKQLSSLSVGPLVTHETGICGRQDLRLMPLCSGFISLSASENGRES